MDLGFILVANAINFFKSSSDNQLIKIVLSARPHYRSEIYAVYREVIQKLNCFKVVRARFVFIM